MIVVYMHRDRVVFFSLPLINKKEWEYKMGGHVKTRGREYKVHFVVSNKWDWWSSKLECQNLCEKEERDRVKSDIIK